MDAALLMVTIAGDITGISAAVRGANNLIRSFQNTINRAIENSTRLLIIDSILNTIKGSFDFATDAVIGFNAMMEQIQVSFTQFTGSAELAQAQIRALVAYAASTPFELKGLLKATQQLQ